MRRSNVNKKSKFKGTMKKYILFLTVICFIFLMYVLNTLYQYEASFTENYMSEVVKDVTKSAKKGKISKICNINNIEVSSLEKNNNEKEDAIEEIFKTSSISFKKSDKSTAQEPVYDILSNDEKIITVKLSVKKQEKRLGLFSYPVWEVKECNLDTSKGLYYYDISVPSNYTVEVNGTKLGKEFVSKTMQDKGIEEISKYTKVPVLVTYKVENLITKPEIKIKDDSGKEINYEENNHKIEILNNYITANNYEDIKGKLAAEIDVLGLAKNWSLFLTNDLSGNLHGFSVLRKNLIKDSSFYNMAYSWATSIDITFVSSHTLKNPTFTNTAVKDFIVYNDKAFSCTVTLEKNMRIANGQDKVDKMYDRLYFAYYDDPTDNVEGPVWKLVDMQSIAEEK